MEILESLAELAKATAKKMELKNQREEQALHCQSCQLPYICLQNVVTPVFSSFFGRKFISEELYCGCNGCTFVVSLPEPLIERDILVLKRKLERRLAFVMKQAFSDIVKAKLVDVTCESIYVRM